MRRLVVAVTGAGLLLAGVPAAADPEPAVPTAAAEREALSVLARAAQAGRSVAYSGTQYVASWREGAGGSTLVDVTHAPGRAAVVTVPPTAGPPPVAPAATAALDPRLLELLAASYDLAVSGPATCTGRPAQVVEAQRAGRVAGRFWVDRASGLLLRREVYDDAGRRVRSSAFVDVQIGDPAAAPPPALASQPDQPAPAELRADGWPVPAALPHGMRLFDTRMTTPREGAHVVQLSYSDGLSTLSLFAQKGRLGTAPLDGFAADSVGERPVWVRSEAPERVVWSGGGQVWTLVSDAPGATVRAAVAALPRDPAPDRGVLARLARGAQRLASLLNPFD